MRARRRERTLALRLAVKELDAVARRVAAPGHFVHAAQRQFLLARARHFETGRLELAGRLFHFLCARSLESKESRTVAIRALHQHALAAVVHAARERIGPAFHHLHCEDVGREPAPRVEVSRIYADVPQGLNWHRPSPRSLSDLRCTNS